MKFGVREICDVTFKTTAAGQKVGSKTFDKAGMPAFFIDTATTSSLEQATTTVYANGGRGNSRLIAWEGEKTMTFTIEDALISPMGLAVLSGAGLVNATEDNVRHVHITLDKNLDVDGNTKVTLFDLLDELGLSLNDLPKDGDSKPYISICNPSEIPVYATVIDGSGAGIDFVDEVTIASSYAGDEVTGDITTTGGKFYKNTITVTQDAAATFSATGYGNKTVKLDFYVVMATSVTEVTIAPEDFGGYFYIEAQTLFRREDSGKDMAAEIIIPKAKVQSGFTFTMAASGDPSTFTFTIDAFPGYTMFDRTKKVMCVMQLIGTDGATGDEVTNHSHDKVTP